MPSIADLLGVTWGEAEVEYRLSPHARAQCASKGISEADVLAAANDPAHTYPNGRYEGQMRHIRDAVCAVVDPARRVVVTIYANVVQTDLREDQRTGTGAADALAYEQGRTTAA